MVPEGGIKIDEFFTDRHPWRKSSLEAVLGTWLLRSLGDLIDNLKPLPLCRLAPHRFCERWLYVQTWMWACRKGHGPACHNPIWTHSEPLTHCHILWGGAHFMTAICQRQVTAAPCPHHHPPTPSPVVIPEVSQEFREPFLSQFMFQKEVAGLQRHNSSTPCPCGVSAGRKVCVRCGVCAVCSL